MFLIRQFILWQLLLSVIDGEPVVSYNRPTVCAKATWNSSGITYNRNIVFGEGDNSIFISTNNTIYALEFNGNQLFVWRNGSETSIAQTTVTNDPNSFFVTLDGDIYIEDGDNKQVKKWSPIPTEGVNVSFVSGRCFGLFIDINNTLYCSIKDLHIVERRPLNGSIANMTTIVAGVNNLAGSAAHQLHGPRGIFVHTNFSLYVADQGNNRVQLFHPGETNGITVVQNQSAEGRSLNGPTGIVLDGNDNLFITDRNNHRVVRFGTFGLQCLFGCSHQAGDTSSQLKHPHALAFDREGNIFVTDTDNKRIQKFLLTSNLCDATTSTGEVLPTTTYNEASLTTTLPSPTNPDDSTTSSLSPSSTPTMESSTNALSTVLSTASSEEKTSSSTTTTDGTISQSTPSPPDRQDPLIFIAPKCKDSRYIGFHCNISSDICTMADPCRNDGTCNLTSTESGYVCLCRLGFGGPHCELDRRPCKPYTCFYHGECNETSATTFNCTCEDGWEGTRCESMTNYCHNVTCLNNGVCRPLLLDYKCECLGTSYSGRHCEITATNIRVFQFISKSFAYVVIIALISVFLFVVIMDILKYGFGIDPVGAERERMRRERLARRRRGRLIQRYIYVNAPERTPDHSTIISKRPTV